MKTSVSLNLVTVALLVSLLTGCATTEGDWRKTQRANSTHAYEKFLKKHPNSEFSNEARKRVEELEWSTAKRRNTTDSYQWFIKKYPNSHFANEAVSRMMTVEWGSVKRTNTVKAYQAFLEKYPAGPYASEATESIAYLSPPTSDWLAKSIKMVTMRATNAPQKFTSNRIEGCMGSGCSRPGIHRPVETMAPIENFTFLIVTVVFEPASSATLLDSEIKLVTASGKNLRAASPDYDPRNRDAWDIHMSGGGMRFKSGSRREGRWLFGVVRTDLKGSRLKIHDRIFEVDKYLIK